MCERVEAPALGAKQLSNLHQNQFDGVQRNLTSMKGPILLIGLIEAPVNWQFILRSCGISHHNFRSLLAMADTLASTVISIN